MTRIKAPAVAGLFYPNDAGVLQHDVDGYLAAAAPDDSTNSDHPPHALIAPHAGYQYSGEVAARAYAQLRPWIDRIRRVAVFAPSHRVAFRGMALSSAERFATPLGEIDVDTDSTARLIDQQLAHVRDAAFAEEHALEVQLPFLQAVLGEFLLVPVIVGDAASDDVAGVMEALQSDDTLIVVSSDLSHFLTYSECQDRDRNTTAMIEQLNADQIGPYDACGAYPIRGLLRAASRHGWRVKTLDLRNSGDTSGDHSRVVGYGAYAFY